MDDHVEFVRGIREKLYTLFDKYATSMSRDDRFTSSTSRGNISVEGIDENIGDDIDEYDAFESEHFGSQSTKSQLDLYLEENRLDRKKFPDLNVLDYWKTHSHRATLAELCDEANLSPHCLMFDLSTLKVWGKTGSKVYGPRAGLDYKDNQLRFSLLCQAALEAPQVLNLNNSENFSGPYGEDVVFIANDWHTTLLPCYLKTMYQSRGLYKNAKVAFCIHSIAYQGRFPFRDFTLVNLPNEFKSSFDFIDGNLKPAKGRKINWIKAGII
ncbi:granule-bound starch synthase 1, chloroplastic/amyloplastic-like [Eucalyptus grandis]|uniref:granule-bound starch synthase 1, chloroplastic/amyloplastic-like n=1 Tax=Eucalyptus grandis TaxID=71139 RepID=UPI00192EE383|nr:granule-bound starch synthase 1, chloroplastic/amyloplastic-like [Eucalyptus grandis]